MSVAEILDQKSTPEARGKRLKSLRMMAGLSRKALEDKYSVSASTMQSWEDAKAGGLTEKGARRAIEVFRQEGIRCAVDWLLFGIGLPPQLSDKLFQQHVQLQEELAGIRMDVSEERAIVNELLAFRQHNPDAVEFIVSDDGMAPFFMKGDYVAGKRRYNEGIDHVLNMDCIVETKENEILLRRLKPGSKSGLYTLVCLNPVSGVIEYALHDKEILSAAPVIWLRRKDPCHYAT
jgi:HTH-type transcriptional regulator, cell division transcriptional repressor